MAHHFQSKYHNKPILSVSASTIVFSECLVKEMKLKAGIKISFLQFPQITIGSGYSLQRRFSYIKTPTSGKFKEKIDIKSLHLSPGARSAYPLIENGIYEVSNGVLKKI